MTQPTRHLWPPCAPPSCAPSSRARLARAHPQCDATLAVTMLTSNSDKHVNRHAARHSNLLELRSPRTRIRIIVTSVRYFAINTQSALLVIVYKQKNNDDNVNRYNLILKRLRRFPMPTAAIATTRSRPEHQDVRNNYLGPSSPAGSQ